MERLIHFPGTEIFNFTAIDGSEFSIVKMDNVNKVSRYFLTAKQGVQEPQVIEYDI